MFLFCYQVWAYTGNDEVRCDDICLDVASRGANVMMIKCHHQKGNQVWNYDEQVKATRLCCCTILLLQLVSWLLFFQQTKQLRHVNSNQCMAKQAGNQPVMISCNANDVSQRWLLKNTSVEAAGAK